MMDHFDRIHSYVHIDFIGMDLFTDELFPVADQVEYLVTGLDVFTLIRVYVDHQGLFIALDPDEAVEPVITAIRERIDSPPAEHSNN